MYIYIEASIPMDLYKCIAYHSKGAKRQRGESVSADYVRAACQQLGSVSRPMQANPLHAERFGVTIAPCPRVLLACGYVMVTGDCVDGERIRPTSRSSGTTNRDARRERHPARLAARRGWLRYNAHGRRNVKAEGVEVERSAVGGR